ncbi:MAG: response regulator [Deltaproteobacteria bacterium]|nr:response regulator [Deltaproteobacteria bacterium]MBW2266126.1 response regulator [Deltaproteobacteria bacterium]
MLKVLLVSLDKDSLSGLASGLAKHGDVELSRAESGIKALDMIADAAVDLVVADESLGDMTGLEFIGKLLSVNPMVNSALVSSLSHQDFHDASEGLGVLAQLPIRPGDEEAEGILQRLKDVKDITAGVDGITQKWPTSFWQ